MVDESSVERFLNDLDQAAGVSLHVIAAFVDVRGFTLFAERTESVDTAMYLRKLYQHLAGDVFPDCSFAKPTGDGLMLIFEFEEDGLKETVESLVTRAVDVVADFGSLLDGDPMINFSVPQRVGIGIARGSATRLGSERATLDYSGRPLNLAARLVNYARPEGVIFSVSVGPELLGEEVRGLFEATHVFVKGIAQAEPHQIFFQSGTVEIPASAYERIDQYAWSDEPWDSCTVAEARRRGGNFQHQLTVKPIATETIELHLEWQQINEDGSSGSITRFEDLTMTYVDDAGGHAAQVDYRDVVKLLEAEQLPDEWPIVTQIRYRVPLRIEH